jgi:hypothetical protein
MHRQTLDRTVSIVSPPAVGAVARCEFHLHHAGSLSRSANALPDQDP